MRRTLMLPGILALASICSARQPIPATLSPDSGGNSQASYPKPAVKGIFRPKLSLQDALQIAEQYISNEHIDMRPFFLYRASYLLLGDETTPDEKKVPGWHFWWMNENGALGDYVEIFVAMDGKAHRMPSM